MMHVSSHPPPDKSEQLKRVLLVEDDPSERSGMEALLRSEGYEVEVVADGAEGLSRLREHHPDLVVTDLSLPSMAGDELLAKAQEEEPIPPVIIVSGTDDVGRAIQALKSGAADFITKPIDIDAFRSSVRMACALAEEERAERQADDGDASQRSRNRKRFHSSDPLPGMMGDSPPMQRIYGLARRVAKSKASVLITGESGTGKGALAEAIHKTSDRADAPFVSVHAAALVENLLESELFGHERGAFTGADKRRVGRFEQANGGTLFLDEVGEIPMLTQVKLLRVLQEKTFERVGGNEPIKVDVRLICATNRDLAKEVREGRFREDLFYRLNVVHIEMPPLRVRDDDVLELAGHFLARFTDENGKSIDGFTNSALKQIKEHPWPGNVRELENAVERAVVLCEDARIDEDHLPLTETLSLNAPACQSLAEIEKSAIISTLEAVNWSTSKAAEILGISVRTIQYRLHQYGLANRRRGN